MEFPVEYVKRHFPDKCAALIKAADEIAAKRFYFALHWETERTPNPVFYEGDIDWLYQPGDDPEWVFAFNRMKYWILLGQAYALTADEKYKRAFCEQLTSWVTNVKQNDPSTKSAWRSIEVGLRLEYWQKARAYFGELSADVQRLYEQSIREQADFAMGVWDGFNLLSNWGVFTNHGLFLAGVSLNENTYKREALKRLESELNIQVMRDGFHWEQSPAYHNETLHCCIDVVQYARMGGVTLSENFLSKTKAMCVADIYAAKPNRHILGMGDSDDVDQRGILTRAAWLFNDSCMRTGGFERPDFDSAWEMGAKGVAEYEAIKPTPPAVTDKFLSDSGNMFFRSGWGENDTFVHFHCGTLGGGHGHGDKLHVDVFAGGEDILLDAGRHSYVFGQDSRVVFKEVKAHNTVRANKADIYKCVDSWEYANLTRAVNQHFYADERYGYAEGGHLGYGFLSNRRVIYIKPSIIILVDEFYAQGKNSYEQFFHFNNKRDVTVENGVCRYGNAASLQFISTAAMSQTLEASVFSRRYNEKESNTVLVNNFEADGFVCAFTVISLGGDCKIAKLPVLSTFKGVALPDDTIEAITVNGYTIVTAHKEFAAPTDSFDVGGCVGFGNCVVFASNECETGTVLLW